MFAKKVKSEDGEEKRLSPHQGQGRGQKALHAVTGWENACESVKKGQGDREKCVLMGALRTHVAAAGGGLESSGSSDSERKASGRGGRAAFWAQGLRLRSAHPDPHPPPARCSDWCTV